MKKKSKLLLALVLLVPASAGAQTLSGGTLKMPSHGFDSTGGTLLTGGGLSLLGSFGPSSASSASGGGIELLSGPFAAKPVARANLERLHAFPIPFRPSRGHDRITFRGLTTHSKIRVFTASGWLVATLEKFDWATEDLIWNPVVNNSGQPLASGVYVYVAEGDVEGRKIGKIMVIK